MTTANTLAPVSVRYQIVNEKGVITSDFKKFIDALWNRTGGISSDILASSNNLSDLLNIVTARVNLGLGSAATSSSGSFLQNSNNLSDLTSVSTAITNLGLGTIVTQNAASVTISGTVNGIISGTYTGTADVTTFKINSTAVTSTANEINKLHGAPLDSSFVVGTEATNVINVAIQLKDADGNNAAVRGGIHAYFSDDANGDSIVATAPSGTVVIGTNGVLYDVGGNKKVFLLISKSNGTIDINITEAAAKTLYLILILPNGTLKASTAITFV